MGLFMRELLIGGAVFCLGQRGGGRGAGRAGLYAGGAEDRTTLGRGGGGRRVLRLSSEEEAEFDCKWWDTGECMEPRIMSLSLLYSRMEKWREIRDCWLWFPTDNTSTGAQELMFVSLEVVKLFSNSKSCWDSLASRSPAEVARVSKVMDVCMRPLKPRIVCWERRVSALPIIKSASLALACRVSFFCLWL